jgi:hypothetical protein
MTMPGFTAEASVYRTRERYRFAVALSADTEKQGVVPQWFGPSSLEECLAGCYTVGRHGLLNLDLVCVQRCWRFYASYEGP